MKEKEELKQGKGKRIIETGREREKGINNNNDNRDRREKGKGE